MMAGQKGDAMSQSDFNNYVERARAQHGDRLDLSELPEKFRPYFRERIRVRAPWGGDRPEKNGVLGVTTGWRPIFILMLRTGAVGSSYTISEAHEFVRMAPLKPKR